MADYLTTDTELASVANAIRTKGGTSSLLVYPAGYVSAINAIPTGGSVTTEPLSVTVNGTYTAPSGTAYTPVTVNVPSGGGGSVPAKDVNFRDYDGTVVNAYTKTEFLALSAMPANPSHDGLTSQGWNWSYADARAYVAKYGRLEVGQMYITDDGKTRVYIHLEEGRTSPMLGVCPSGTVDVDWGDGTAHDTLTGTSVTSVKWTPTHHYAAPGDYVIKLAVTGSMGFYGVNSTDQYAALLRYSSGGDTRNYAYRNAIQCVEIGGGVTGIEDYSFYYCQRLSSITIPDSVMSIGASVFYYCYSLTSITIPDGVTNIGTRAFYGCYSLTSITIPDGVTSIGASMFNNCYALTIITIPDGVTSIGASAVYSCSCLIRITIPDSVTSIETGAFNYCSCLTIITIPDGVTSIGANAFRNCRSAVEYHLAPTTPPTLENTNAFSSIADDCVIYVPYSADHSVLNAYKTASNWSTYASKMQEEPT